MAWPSNVSTIGTESDSDELTDGRPSINSSIDATNDIIDSRDSASGIPSLDASSKVTESQLRQVNVPVIKTANFTTTSVDLGRIFICEGPITVTVDDLISVPGYWHYFKNGNLGSTDDDVLITVTANDIEGEGTITLRPGDGVHIVRGTTRWSALGAFREDVVGGTTFTPRRFSYFSEEVYEQGANWTTITSDVAEATWETVGPTGSGADNIWDALDDIPGLKGFVLISATAICSGTSAGEASVFLSVRENGGSLGFADREVVVAKGYVLASGATQVESRSQRAVPIDSNGIFEIYWDADANNSSTTIRATIAGFYN